MNEIVLITSYTPTIEKESILRNLVYKLNELNYKIAISTHSIIPIDICEKCDFIFYEKKNKIVYDPEIQYWLYSKHNNITFQYKPYNTMSTHILPILSMTYGSLKYLKFLGYNTIHHIEYDTKLFNENSLIFNAKMLETYDCVSYYDDKLNNKNNYLIGHLFSFNLSKLNLDNLEYDEAKILSRYKEYFDKKITPITEKIIYDTLYSNLNIFWANLSDFMTDIELNLSDKVNSYVKNNCTFNLVNNILHFYSYNKTNISNNITILINSTIIKSFNQDPFNWKWISLEIPISDVKEIKLLINDKLIKKLDMGNKEDFDYIYKWSKIIYN
jgi:hypothetical protein